MSNGVDFFNVAILSNNGQGFEITQNISFPASISNIGFDEQKEALVMRSGNNIYIFSTENNGTHTQLQEINIVAGLSGVAISDDSRWLFIATNTPEILIYEKGNITYSLSQTISLGQTAS